MHIEISPVKDIPSSLLVDINQRSREMLDDGPGGSTEWVGGEWQLLVWEGQTWVSALQLLQRTITVGGKPLCVGGVGGVMTLPEWRQRGYATAAMKHANLFIRDKINAPFGLLVTGPERIHFYQSAGWSVVSGPLTYHQTTGQRTFSEDTIIMVYACTEQPWPDRPIDLCGPPW